MSLELYVRPFNPRNRGPYSTFLDSFALAAKRAVRRPTEGYVEFSQVLLKATSDERNLKIAADHIRTQGGGAPGPDGVSIHSVGERDIWRLTRSARDAIRHGTYQRGGLRACRVPKRPGSQETRTIWVSNLVDHVVARAAAQVLRPLLDHLIPPQSYSWHQRGPLLALADARRLVLEESRTVWIVEDMRNAFDRVPRARLRQILRAYIPCDEFCEFVLHMAAAPTSKKRGILQGSPLSPLLLELYLRHLLHLPWQRQMPSTPLLQYVDDIMIPCGPEDDVSATYQFLRRLFLDMGMKPKFGCEQSMANLRHEKANWLGYRLRCLGSDLEIRSQVFDARTSEEKSHSHELLIGKFAKLHDTPEGWRYVDSLIWGFLQHLAPTFNFSDRAGVYRQIAVAAKEAGFEEIPNEVSFFTRWRGAHDRWQFKCKIGLHTESEQAVLSAEL